MIVKLADLIERAHAQSVKSGFWEHDEGCVTEKWASEGDVVPPEVQAARDADKRACQCKNLDLAMKRSLIHSEISEALEEFRLTGEKRGGPLGAILYKCYVWKDGQQVECRKTDDVAHPQNHVVFQICAAACAGGVGVKHKPEGFIVELADAAIRLFDLCGRTGLELRSSNQVLLRQNDELKGFSWGEIIESLHDGVTGLQLGNENGTHVELLAMLEYAAHRAGGDIWTAIDVKMTYNSTRERMHGKTC